LECNRRIDTLIWIEAEQFLQATGWMPETAYVIDWLGDGYLMDSFGSQEAVYTTTFPDSDQGYVWVRSLKRAVDNSPAFLSHGSQSFPFANTATNLSIWAWERLGPYDLAGSDHWVITRPYTEDAKKFMALFVDVLVFTTDALYDPQSSPSYVPLADEVFSVPGQTQGILSIALIPGHYQCRALAASSLPLVDALGNSPVSSQPVEFDVPK
jgi:hypothetical protein